MNERIQELDDILNQEIVRESLLEMDPNIDDALVKRIWEFCNGNPWNAVPLYKMLKVAGKL